MKNVEFKNGRWVNPMSVRAFGTIIDGVSIGNGVKRPQDWVNEMMDHTTALNTITKFGTT